jgi:hypothetical protein
MYYSSFLRRFLGAFSVLLLVCSVHSYGQTIVTVGKQPLAIIPVGNTIHVFCNGVDNNFNSIYEPDSGDVAASWWVIDGVTRTVLKHRDFTDRYLPFPFRAVVTDMYTYIPNGNHLSRFLTSTQDIDKKELITLPDSLGQIVAVSKPNSNPIFTLSSRKNYDKPGYVLGVDIENAEILGAFQVLINPQQTIDFVTSDKNSFLAVLNEGVFNGNNSALQVFGKNFEVTTFPLGDGGNHIFYQGDGHDSLYTTVNGSHKVVIVDMIKKEIVKTIPIGTTGFNGPRESAVIGNKLFVTTYNSDVREFDLETGALVATLDSKGKPEGLTVIDGKLWVANAFVKGGYAPDSTVAVFDSPHAVEEYFTENKNIMYPNPATVSTMISTTFNGQANTPVQVEVYSLVGTKLFSTIAFSGDTGEVKYLLPIQENNLTSGTYFVRLSAGHRVQTSRLTVVE